METAQKMFASFKKKQPPSGSAALVAYEGKEDPVVYAKRNSSELFQAATAGNRFAVLPQISLPASALEAKNPSSDSTTRRTYSPAKVYSIPIKPSEDSIPLAFEEDMVVDRVDQQRNAAQHRASMLGNLFPTKTRDSFSYSMVIKEGPSEDMSFRIAPSPVKRRTAIVEPQRVTPPPPGLEESTANETSRAANLASLFPPPPPPSVVRTISTVAPTQSGYRVLEMGSAEMDRYAKMRKMGLPQGAIENAMLKDMVHPKSMYGNEAINANPVPPQIVIQAVDESKRAASLLGAEDKGRSLIEELARKQQEKKADVSGLSVEERIQLNKRKQVSGSTPISMISKLRPSSGLRKGSNALAAGGDAPLILRPPSRITGGGAQQQQQRKAKSNPFENLNDLLVCLKLEAPVLQVSKLLVAEGFDTPEKFVLYLGAEDEQEALQHLSSVLPNNTEQDVKKILSVLPLLEEMTRCKEALESHDAGVIDRALTEYQHLLQRLKEQYK